MPALAPAAPSQPAGSSSTPAFLWDERPVKINSDGEDGQASLDVITFVDGNKRTGFVTAITFIELNGFRFGASEVDATVRTLALAAGQMGEAAFFEWLRTHSKRA